MTDEVIRVLINSTGEYEHKTKVFYITDNHISRDTLIKMLKQSPAPQTSVEDYEKKVFEEPAFTRNLTHVIFEPSLTSEHMSYRTSNFRSTMGVAPNWEELKTEYEILNKASLTFNEALFVLLGFNCVLAPDKYEIISSAHPIDKAILDTKQGDMLIGLFDEEKFTLATCEFLKWAAAHNFLAEKQGKDDETGIPLHRYKIYKETLPTFFKTLSNPISIREMTIKSDEITDGEYTKIYKDMLKVGGGTIRNEIPKMLKIDWWKRQTKKVKENAPENFKKARTVVLAKQKKPSQNKIPS